MNSDENIISFNKKYVETDKLTDEERIKHIQSLSKKFDAVGDIWVDLFKIRERMKAHSLNNILLLFDVALEGLMLEMIQIEKNKKV